MRLRASIAVIMILFVCRFGISAPGAAQDDGEGVSAVFEGLVSFDESVLQAALKAKYIQKPPDTMMPGRESLRYLVGLSGVTVWISPGLKECGVTEEIVRARTELRLRQNGILVTEPPRDPNGFKAWMLSHPRSIFNMASLFVSMESISLSRSGIMAVSVEVSQSQLANLLSAERPVVVLLETWTKGEHVIGSRQRVAAGCFDAMNELLDMYCNDWLATHPATTRIHSDPNSTTPDDKD
ncbi:MAG: hypothetical protein JW993_15090 [Sedimentisphaerales bacterium]|nr:hypothetical protein [Sedimentisphaerales bacterium]